MRLPRALSWRAAALCRSFREAVAVADRASPQRERFAELLGRVAAALAPVRAAVRMSALARAAALVAPTHAHIRTPMRCRHITHATADAAFCAPCALHACVPPRQRRRAFSDAEEASLQRTLGLAPTELSAMLDGAATAFQRAAAAGASAQARLRRRATHMPTP
jgi:hypothetical protein